MKMTLSTYHAASLLQADENANWSSQGAVALVEHLESLEEDTGEEIELAVVAIRCDYSEYHSLFAWADEYFSGDSWMTACGVDYYTDDEVVINAAIRQYIEDHGTLIEFETGIIVSSF